MHLPRFILVLFVFLGIAAGCAAQKTEYRTSPSWHSAMGGSLPAESVRADGTIVKYSNTKKPASSAMAQYINSIQLVEKNDVTGETTLRAVLPTHIFTQALTCLRDKDWDLLFNHVISKKTQSYYKSLDDELETFKLFFLTNRKDIAKTLQRMMSGSRSGDTYISTYENKTVYAFTKNIRGSYIFTKVTLVQEGPLLKLHSIE